VKGRSLSLTRNKGPSDLEEEIPSISASAKTSELTDNKDSQSKLDGKTPAQKCAYHGERRPRLRSSRSKYHPPRSGRDKTTRENKRGRDVSDCEEANKIKSKGADPILPPEKSTRLAYRGRGVIYPKGGERYQPRLRAWGIEGEGWEPRGKEAISVGGV